MIKVIDKIFKFAMFVGIPYMLITLAFDYLGAEFGFGVMILCFTSLFMICKPKIYTIIGRLKYNSDHDEGFKFMEKAYKTGRMKPQDALIYAYVLIRDGHITKAERIITSIMKLKRRKLTEQNICAAKLNMAIILWKQNDLPAAIAKMEEVYDSGYRSTVMYQTLGLFYILNNSLDKAEEFIKESIEYNSTDASIQDNLGLLCIKQGNYEKAEKVYEELFDSSEPEFIEANYNYAVVLEHKGDYESACDYYMKALGCPERYLSSVKHSLVELKLSDAEAHLPQKDSNN